MYNINQVSLLHSGAMHSPPHELPAQSASEFRLEALGSVTYASARAQQLCWTHRLHSGVAPVAWVRSASQVVVLVLLLVVVLVEWVVVVTITSSSSGAA